MKGDFSHWRFDPNENFNGVLQQQGRVLLDRDWNEQTRITTHWQDVSGRDAIGGDVAAVPTSAPDGFRVTQANVTGAAPDQRVELQVTPGRAWVDGLLCYLAGPPPAIRAADYLNPPIDPTPGSIDTIAPGVRDAVVLEVSREELSAFQVPDRLLEPALGGPDTTERAHLRMAFTLFRLQPGETCRSIIPNLRHDPSTKGRLTVRLQPTVTVPGDCPVVAGGGYTGFEHHLYRLEIAAVNAAQPPSFKWSQFNGGLVGRGELRAAPNRITITANLAAILNSGLSQFYCEVIAFDPDRGVWFSQFGADVTLNGTELTIGTVRLGSFAASTSTVFFRLWNGIRPIADFTNAASPQELLDGIQLVFDPATAANYAPGDYWNFPVRAGEIANPEVLIDNHAPFGPVYHRAPLAEINWGAVGAPVVPPQIEDCRRRFRPLTRLDTCCTVRVGDGETSLGDYENIQQAVDSLPAEGGMVCILPGVYRQRVTLDNRQNVTLSGCGPRTRLISPADDRPTEAVITILGGRNIAIESLAVEAETGRGILALGRNPFSRQGRLDRALDGLSLTDLHVASTSLAAVRVDHARNVLVRGCELRMRDVGCQEHTLMMLADDVLIERNLVEVAARDSVTANRVGGFQPGGFSRGGIHLQSLSDRVQVIDNLIRGGCGNGITLGSVVWWTDQDEPVPPEDEPVPPEDDPCEPTRAINIIIAVLVLTIGDGLRIRRGAGGPLYDIRIERNRIHQMGANGIGVAGFFNLAGADEFIAVNNLAILGNDIRGCLRRRIEPVPENMNGFMGYGGIALADVENLLVHDNVIVNNGRDHLDPVCGVFVLHGEGVDLQRNRIVNNGARTDQPASDARRGPRGGVVIRFALPPTIPVEIGRLTAPMQNGVPAARLHDNIVSAPLGRALTLSGVGPMSIVANQFTSQGIPPQSADATSFLAGAVQILNLGVSNELYFQIFLYAALTRPNADRLVAAAGAKAVSRAGLDDATFGRLLANGQIQFNDNQVNLDLLARGVSVAFASSLIMTLDDIGFHDNQCEANLLDDFLLANSLLLAVSQRVTGNRWKEGIRNAWISALTLSFLMNTTTENQGTHCIVVRGLPSHLIDDSNTALIQGVLGSGQEGVCNAFNQFMSSLRRDG